MTVFGRLVNQTVKMPLRGGTTGPKDATEEVQKICDEVREERGLSVSV